MLETKIIVANLNGILLDDDHKISEKTCQSLQEVQRKGLIVVFLVGAVICK